MKRILNKMFILLVILEFSILLFAQSTTDIPDKTLDARTRNEAISEILTTIKDNYFSVELGEKMDSAIRARMAKKEYDSITSAKVLADTLTRHLYEICQDKHVYVRVSDNSNPTAPPPDMGKEGNFGFPKIEILSGNIGYLQINSFPPPQEAGETLAAAMKFLKNTNALIIDLRQHRGGAIPMVALMVSYFVPEKPVQLITVDAPRNRQTFESWTVEKVDAPRYLGKPVYLLTSQNTFSGGEEFAYDMQALKRAKLIGETTKGGANPVQIFPIQNIFRLGVSFAQVKNTITGTNWEGVGVKPDIPTTAEKALEVAIETATKDLAESKKTVANNEPQIKMSGTTEITSFPDTPIGKTFQTFLEAFNSGDGEKLRNFHLARLENSEEGKRIAEENSKQDLNFYQTSGGLIPKKILNSTETKIQIVAQFKQKNEWIIFTMEVASKPPYPIIGLSVEQTPPLK